MSRLASHAVLLFGLLFVGALGACHDDEGSEVEVDAAVAVPADLAVVSPTVDATVPLDLNNTGHVDPDGGGGDVSLLSFAVFGDVRPPIPDDDIQYPTTTVTGIMKEIATTSPQFAIATGDYMYVEFLSSSAKNQLGLLKSAEALVPAPIFHALGNHECNSFADVNCPNLNESVNVTAFLQQLVAFTPTPWYSFIVHTALGDAKFLFIAANAWTDAQSTWLQAALAVPTKYTFVIRHQPTPDAGDDSGAPGVAGSDAFLTKYPVTLFLYGHVHEYLHLTTNAVIAGNAGAPLVMGSYGWLEVKQRADETISVTAHQLGVQMPIDTWAVTPTGQKAP